MADTLSVTRIGDGAYRVHRLGRAEVVYVATTGGTGWAWWNGRVFRTSAQESRPREQSSIRGGHQIVVAPMPATLLKVLVRDEQTVKKGETLVILEAMKMELPLRATADAVVKRVLCREGELVQADTTLVELLTT